MISERFRWNRWFHGFVLGFLTFLSMETASAEEPGTQPLKPRELREGDRVVFLGGTFIERAQTWGYLEAALTVPGKTITFRNLGWSGDTVWAESRGIFDAPHQGYQRMLEQLRELKPTLILINYGSNESFEGEPGLQRFLQQYGKLLDEVQNLNADVVLIGPHLQFHPGPPFPNPQDHNEEIKLYSAAIAALASERGLPFVDLTQWDPHPWSDREVSPNGIHLSQLGYWSVCQFLRNQFGIETTPRAELSSDGKVNSQHGVTLESLTLVPDRNLRWELQLGQLPLWVPETVSMSTELELVIGGLPEGEYQLQVDGKSVVTASADKWEEGVGIVLAQDQKQAERLQMLIVDKNELAFYQWRPQNVTYLFLFRKHEQGNNAKEIPQFDPLIAEKEHEISEVKTPSKHQFQLVPVKNP